MTELIFKQNLRVLIQGITGREGQRGVEFMQNYHTNVVAGVTPGKGGQAVSGVEVFNNISEAIEKYGPVDASSIYVPVKALVLAVSEALQNKIKLIHILTADVPLKDLAQIVALAHKYEATILGPDSLGSLVTGQSRLGMLGGTDPDKRYKEGGVGIISRSGGMTNEIAHQLSLQNIGIRAAVHMGTGNLAVTKLIDHIRMFENDPQTKQLFIFEEATHGSLKELINFINLEKPQKPITLNIAGLSQSAMPLGAPFGHLDALLNKDNNEITIQIAKLKQQGVKVVDSFKDYSDNIIIHNI